MKWFSIVVLGRFILVTGSTFNSKHNHLDRTRVHALALAKKMWQLLSKSDRPLLTHSKDISCLSINCKNDSHFSWPSSWQQEAADRGIYDDS